MAVDLSALPDRIRHRFKVFEHRVYLNSCSQGALSDAVRDAYAEYLDGWDEHGAPWEYWVGQAEAARGAFAGLVGAQSHDVAVTTSVSAGVSALASALTFDRGRSKVVLTDFEFPTIGQIWHAQEPRGAKVVHVAAQADNTIPLERFDAAIDTETLLVSVTAVCYRNGSRLDLGPIIELAHERGALVLVDAYQAAGALPLDVTALGADFLTAGALKYLLGSAGLAWMWVRPGLAQELLPTQTGWFADDDIFAMDNDDYSPSPTARRFESGTPPIPNSYAAIAGVNLMRDIGVEATAAHVAGLNQLLVDGVTELGGRVVTPAASRGPLVCVAATDQGALVARLAERGLVTSSRDGNLRVSPHCYNTVGDIEALLEGLRANHHLVAPRSTT